MRGTSLASREATLAAFAPVLEAAGEEAVSYGKQLLDVVDLLDANGTVRRALTDPARDAQAKASLIQGLFGPHVAAAVCTALVDAIGHRWIRIGDFVSAIEHLGFVAVFYGARNGGRLEEVSQELWFASQALAGQPEVRTALTDPRADARARGELVGSLFADKVSEEALTLIVRAAAYPRGRHLVPFLQSLSDLGATLRNRTVAHVTSNTALSEEQIERIESILGRKYGRRIQVDVTVDRSVIGGVRIQVGPDVVDQTVVSRLTDIRRQIAS
ncbi:F0F1 ATP synthase subunit delta [Rarobacter incanus]|uniref:ATP synthase subunit delta n=1 Tax=Rarobacter incanus TaxID=153494 RepID=A0A542SRF3_9MICO|nr:F0F1 ATP synthase subunit delta [Rarobacter incanus]TQK77200.1 ATP synthase F1 subcomplex delta subunit [Rarobacter incanus]